MPEYLKPGVYIEEMDYRSKSIVGMNTSVTGFVGPTQRGPADDAPKPLTSFADFEHTYGGLDPLVGETGPMCNYVAHAARVFFENGGTRLYIARVPEGADEEAYAGTEVGNSEYQSGLKALEAIEDISIVATPGATSGQSDDRSAAIAEHLIEHCERMRHRFAVLDPPEGQTIAAVRSYRARFDSRHAALYYPWVQVEDPITGREIYLPPSGFMAGLYARNDADHGVHKAPANLGVRLADGLERHVTLAESVILNTKGLNNLRFFDGRGYLVRGARTICSDSEWKYVSLRRYFNYLEQSIDRGTQWVVFEPNSEPLWDNVCKAIQEFLLSEWRSGALLGSTPEQAFFVRCDRSTMTLSDVDNGRLVCEVGVAPIKPGEFVIFKIVRKTVESQ
jgi:phage tail sheath protein FI